MGDPRMRQRELTIELDGLIEHLQCVIHIFATRVAASAQIEVVRLRVAGLRAALELPAEAPALEQIRRVVALFRELRAGVTEDGKAKVKSPSSTLSTAEAISVMTHGLTISAHFGDGTLKAADLAGGLIGAIVKDPVQDTVVFKEYLETIVKERDGWKDVYRACRDHLS